MCHKEIGLRSQLLITAPNSVFSVTYQLELRSAIIVYCMSHILSTKAELVAWILSNFHICALVNKQIHR